MIETKKLLKGVYENGNVFYFSFDIIKLRLSDYNIKPYLEIKNENKIYFLPGCSVPRFKLKPFVDKYNLVITRNINEADFIFINKQSINLKSTYETLLKREDGIPEDKINLLNSYNADYIVSSFDYKYYYKIWTLDSISYNNLKCLEDYNDNVYEQNCILSFINEENYDIDYEKYLELKTLLESNNEDNVCLALEIMANANYITSAPYILSLLLNIALYSKNKFIYHTNTVSMFNFFDLNLSKERGKYIITFNNQGNILDNCIDILLKYNQFNKYNVHIILESLNKYYNNIFNYKYGKIDIKLKDELLKLLENEKDRDK